MYKDTSQLDIMKTEIKILKKMIEEKKEYTIRELSLLINADYKIVHTACNLLITKKIIKARKAGNSSQLSLTNKFSKEIFEAEYERKEEIIKNKNINLLLEEVKKNIGSVNFILLLFGSYAKKNNNPKSDIDLMFIAPSKYLEKDIEKIISIIPLNIHYLVFTELEFKRMLEGGSPNVIKEAFKNNIILYGVEQYYNLLGEKND
jgi:predicted nucleotidyltransferase